MDDEDKKFCVRCGQRLQEPVKKFLSLKAPEPTYYEFKDGYYCVKCGKIEVEEKRAKK